MRLQLLPLIAFTAACATTGATFKSGVGDTYFDHPPFHAGASVRAGTPAGVFPIAYQRGATQAAAMDPGAGAGTPMAALLDEMNRYLDSLGVGTKLVVTAARGTPPDVQFGCRTSGISLDDCVDPDSLEASHGVFSKGTGALRLAVGRPSKDWTAWADSAMARANVPTALVLKLETGWYYVQQRNLKGSKQVELGTGYTASFPWLTSLDAPVNVLQLTGALMDRNGLAIRIGAEGMLAKRTSFKVSVLGAQSLISDDDVEALRTARRTDLPGQPLVWHVALRNLVAQLTGNSEVAAR